MHKNHKFIYVGLAVILIAVLNIVLSHIVQSRTKSNLKEPIQKETESILPFGNYLPTAENPLIRVVIKTNGFSQVTHSQVQVSASCGLVIQNGETTQEINADEMLSIAPDDARFQNGSIRVTPKTETERLAIHSISRGYGTPSYRGCVELYTTAEGIVIVNEVPVEEYLYAVVPSEMPASYQAEALKCQAVCARSYAYCQMQVFAYPEYFAHVDDSVSFQVYGNSKEQESTTNAVNETAGQKLWFCNEVVKTYYYSTSCGHSTSIEAWGTTLTDENRFLCGVSVCDANGTAYEASLPWYRWTAVIPEQTLSDLIELNTGTEIGILQNVSVTKTGTGGIVLQIEARGTAGTVVVETENRIRKVLGGSGYQITKQDGTTINSTNLLPSAFFLIAKNGENYIIEGGGYGHGIGMSQNGANEMAKTGKKYDEILLFFYPGTKVQ